MSLITLNIIIEDRKFLSGLDRSFSSGLERKFSSGLFRKLPAARLEIEFVDIGLALAALLDREQAFHLQRL